MALLFLMLKDRLALECGLSKHWGLSGDADEGSEG
jgi:hypothetical protein